MTTGTNVLNVMVSASRSVFEGDPLHEINLLTWLQSKKYKDMVDAVRNETNPKRQKSLKRKMPIVTISGTFHESRKKENLKEHSGLICIDIDADDNPNIENWDQIGKELCKLSHAAYVGRSVRGRGFMVIIPIAFPSFHEEHFTAIQAKFLKYGIVIDASCKDVSRARYYSYDDQAYYNFAAVPFTDLPKKETPKREPYNAQSDVEQEVIKYIEEIEKRGIDIAPGYSEWFTLARSLVNEFGESGRGLFHRLCFLHPDYCHRKTDRKYDAAIRKPGSATINTFFYLCKERGITKEALTYL